MAVRRHIRRRIRRARPTVRRSSSSSATAARMDAKRSASDDSGLMIGGVQDPAEKAADQMADRVMRMPASGPVVQRKCAACEGEEKKVKRAPQEQDEEETVQTKSASNSTPVAAGASAVAASPGAATAIKSMGSGKPLARAERAFFEPRFGTDLSSVRIHDGPASDKANRAVKARAFTLGSDVAFAKDEHQPGTETGRRLLAHELAHVVGENTNARREVRRTFGNCTSKSGEDGIVTSHTVSNAQIAGPGDSADITLQFGCKPRSFDSEIIDSAGAVQTSAQKTIWNGKFKPDKTGNWTIRWDGKRPFKKVGTFMADDGVYKHHIKKVAYAPGAKVDKVAKSGGVLSTSPDITVAIRSNVMGQRAHTAAEKEALKIADPSGGGVAASAGTVTQSLHLFDAAGNILQNNVDELATAIRSEAEGFSEAEQKAVAWSIRNGMVRVNSHKVSDSLAKIRFSTKKTGKKAEKTIATDVLQQDISQDPTSGAIKWYSPRSMPPHNGKCKTDGGIFNCTGGTVTLTDGSKKSSKAPGFHTHMTFVNVAGVKQWNFRFYKL